MYEEWGQDNPEVLSLGNWQTVIPFTEVRKTGRVTGKWDKSGERQQSVALYKMNLRCSRNIIR